MSGTGDSDYFEYSLSCWLGGYKVSTVLVRSVGCSVMELDSNRSERVDNK